MLYIQIVALLLIATVRACSSCFMFSFNFHRWVDDFVHIFNINIINIYRREWNASQQESVSSSELSAQGDTTEGEQSKLKKQEAGKNGNKILTKKQNTSLSLKYQTSCYCYCCYCCCCYFYSYFYCFFSAVKRSETAAATTTTTAKAAVNRFWWFSSCYYCYCLLLVLPLLQQLLQLLSNT